jgi:ribosomal-protein-alanine N-acetyltransferase
MVNFNRVLKLKPKQKTFTAQTLSPALESARLCLKTPCLEDFTEWSLVRGKNQNHLTPFEPEWPEDCLTRDFFIRRLERQEEERNAGRGAYFLVHHSNDNAIIGGININNITFGAARHGTLGYWIDKNYEGQGYMREALQVIIDYAFQTLMLRRLNAASLPDNNRSIKLLLSLGFEEEGYAKKYLQINGVWQDHKLFGLVFDGSRV